MIGDIWGIRRPFEVAFCSFLLATLYASVAVPYIDPATLTDGKKNSGKGFSQLFTPLRVLLPQRVLLKNGTVKKHYGVLFLCSGVFLGVVRHLYNLLRSLMLTFTARHRVCASADPAVCCSQVQL